MLSRANEEVKSKKRITLQFCLLSLLLNIHIHLVPNEIIDRPHPIRLNTLFLNMRTLDDITQILINHKARLVADYPIKSLAIFGSYSRDENTRNSDVDILVEFSDKIGIRFIDLAEELEQILGLKVDLVSRKGVKEKYLQSIHPDLVYV